MPRKIVTITHQDGTKKVIIGQSSNKISVKARESEEDRRPKPGTPAVGLTKQRNGYKRGGKIKFKAS